MDLSLRRLCAGMKTRAQPIHPPRVGPDHELLAGGEAHGSRETGAPEERRRRLGRVGRIVKLWTRCEILANLPGAGCERPSREAESPFVMKTRGCPSRNPRGRVVADA